MRRSLGEIAPFRLLVDGEEFEVAATGPLIANDFPTLLSAARDGLDISQVPEPLARDAVATGELVLSDHTPIVPGVFL